MPGAMFDGLRAELPTATLRPTTSQARHRAIGVQLTHWLAARWAWLRPRALPMIAAFVGLIVVMAATKYLPEYSSQRPPAAARQLRHGDHVQPPCRRLTQACREDCGRGLIDLAPPRCADAAGPD